MSVFNLAFGSGDNVLLPLTVDSSLGDEGPWLAPSPCFKRAFSFILAVCSIKERHTKAQLNKY